MLKDYELDKPTLETGRLILRTLTSEDVPALKEWLGRDELYTYWGRKASKSERDPEQMFIDPRPWVKRKPSQDFNWGVVLRESGKAIGEVAIFNVQNQRMASVGYRLHPAYWRQGIITEALQQAVRFVFEQTELERLEATVDVRNTASVRVLEKCGFVKEGTIRQGKMVSTYCDYHVFGLLRQDLAGMDGYGEND
ncbi:MAG: GNAT family N-acetyltransferase [Clostridiales bacterium]|nr:GNAT family N-acetyltransferase [Clostridiales bacterium]